MKKQNVNIDYSKMINMEEVKKVCPSIPSKLEQIECWEKYLGMDLIPLLSMACYGTYVFRKNQSDILVQDVQVDFKNKLFVVTDRDNLKYIFSFKDYGTTWGIHGIDIEEGAEEPW